MVQEGTTPQTEDEKKAAQAQSKIEAKATTYAQKAADKAAKDAEKVAKNESKASGSRYFKSDKSGLSFLDNGVEVARFVPYFELFQGDRVRVGYLELKSGKLADRVAEDAYTQEITAKEFKEATTGKNAQQAGY